MTRAATPSYTRECITCNKEFNSGVYQRKICPKCRMDKYKTSDNFEDYRQRQIVAAKKYKFKKYYGMTQEQFEEMLEAQDNKCAICFTHKDELKVRMNIDHDHTCCPGKETCGNCVRGLICGSCNMALGAFKDNKVLLQRAIDYLDSYTGGGQFE